MAGSANDMSYGDMSHTIDSSLGSSPFITNPSVRLQEGVVLATRPSHTTSSISSDTKESLAFESDVSLFQDATGVEDEADDNAFGAESQTTPKTTMLMGSVTDNIGLKERGSSYNLSTQAIIFSSSSPTKNKSTLRRLSDDIETFSDPETTSPLHNKQTRNTVPDHEHKTQTKQKSARKRDSWRSIRPISTAATATTTSGTVLTSSLPSTASTEPTSRFSLRSMTIPEGNALSARKLDDMNKQLINYKIQVKFFKQFLQKLIEQSQSEGTGSTLDLAELTQLQNNFNDLTLGDFSSPNRNAVAYNRLKEEYEELENNYDQVFKLNDDLYANLEIFQRQLQSREEELSVATTLLEECQAKVETIFKVLISDSQTGSDSRIALQRCLESVTVLPNKLEALKLELNKRLDFHATQQQTERDELTYTVDTVLRLLKNVEHLENEYTDNVKRTEELEVQLQNERGKSAAIAKNFNIITEKFSDFSKSVEDKVEDNTRLRQETDKLILLNAELQSQNSSFKAQVKSSETFIEKLQEQLGQEEQIREKQKQEIEELQQAHMESQKALESNRIVSLGLTSQDRELKELKQKFNDLDASSLKGLEREYLLITEKMNLSKSLRTLQATISKQSETIMSLTRNNNDFKEQIREKDRKYSLLEYQLGEILSLDVLEFEKFFRAMQPITENENGIERSIRQLSKGVENMKALIEAGDLKILREQHQGLFEYFSRAFKKLSKHYGEEVLKTMDLHEEWTHRNEALTSEVASLKNQNQELQKEAADAQLRNKELLRRIAALESQAREDHPTSESSSGNGGATDLVRSAYKQKWKSERESRMLEHNGSQRRVREAEQEIERLQRENANLKAMRNRSPFLQN